MRVFISYRHDDVDVVSRIREDLSHAGHDVFQDMHEIEYGEVFKTTILTRLDAADVVLIVIGPDWLRQVLDETKPDWIRLEVEHALRRAPRPRIIPVLVRDAKPPKEDELPPGMRELLGLHAIAIPSGPGYDFFIARLKKALGGRGDALRRVLAIGGAVVALPVAGFALATVVTPSAPRTEVQSTADAGPAPGPAPFADASPTSQRDDAHSLSDDAPADGGGKPDPTPVAPWGRLGQPCRNGKCKDELVCVTADNICRRDAAVAAPDLPTCPDVASSELDEGFEFRCVCPSGELQVFRGTESTLERAKQSLRSAFQTRCKT